jgi:hypothetical protein
METHLERTLQVKDLAERGERYTDALMQLWIELRALHERLWDLPGQDRVLLALCLNEVGTLLRREKSLWRNEKPEFFVAYDLAMKAIGSIPGAPRSFKRFGSGLRVNPVDLWITIAGNLGFAGLDTGCVDLESLESDFLRAWQTCMDFPLPQDSIQVMELKMGTAKVMVARRAPGETAEAYKLGEEVYHTAERLLCDVRKKGMKEGAFLAYSLAPVFMDFIDVCFFCEQPKVAAFAAQKVADFEIECRDWISDPLFFAEARASLALAMARLLKCDPGFYGSPEQRRKALGTIKDHLRHADALLDSLGRDPNDEAKLHHAIIPIRIRRNHAEALALSIRGRHKEALAKYRATSDLCFEFYWTGGPATLYDLYMDEIDAGLAQGRKIDDFHFNRLMKWGKRLGLNSERLEEIRKRKQGIKAPRGKTRMAGASSPAR